MVSSMIMSFYTKFSPVKKHYILTFYFSLCLSFNYVQKLQSRHSLFFLYPYSLISLVWPGWASHNLLIFRVSVDPHYFFSSLINNNYLSLSLYVSRCKVSKSISLVSVWNPAIISKLEFSTFQTVTCPTYYPIHPLSCLYPASLHKPLHH